MDDDAELSMKTAGKWECSDEGIESWAKLPPRTHRRTFVFSHSGLQVMRSTRLTTIKVRWTYQTRRWWFDDEEEVVDEEGKTESQSQRQMPLARPLALPTSY